MAHIHKVYDTNGHYVIDAHTRLLKNESAARVTLVQHDHNSERVTFELARYVDGHDMSLCNSVRINYINKGASGSAEGCYIVSDLQVSPDDPDVVVFSWLISQHSTQYEGPLIFAIRFICSSDGSTVDYAWSTVAYAGLTVSRGLSHDGADDVYVYDSLQGWIDAVNDSVLIARTAADEAKAVQQSIPEDYAELSGNVAALTEEITELKDEEEGFVDILPLAEKTELGFYQWNDLALVASDYYKTVWCKANAGDRFRITGISMASSADTYNIYRAIDANGAVIARQGNQAGENAFDVDITMPDSTVSVSFTFHVGGPYTVEKHNTTLHERVKLELFDARTRCDGHQYESAGEAIRAATSASYNSFGKTVVWFGTSIPAGCYDASDANTSYPKIIGERLGLTVYNEAVGSSPVHGMRSSQITADNPYGFFTENYKSSALSLATSLEEKEWLITNWDSEVFTGGKYTEMTDALAEEIRNCSYERKLDKYLTANTFPDAFVFDHGRNDMWTSEDWTNDGSNPVNTAKRHSYHQAMNFLIDRILRFRKDAKILIIGHYTDKQRYGEDTVVDHPDKVAQAQAVLASEWNFPLLKTWEHTGWGNKCIYTSGQSKSTIMWAMPDGLHPHSDTTGAAVKKLADIMTPFIRDNV